MVERQQGWGHCVTLLVAWGHSSALVAPLLFIAVISRTSSCPHNKYTQTFTFCRGCWGLGSYFFTLLNPLSMTRDLLQEDLFSEVTDFWQFAVLLFLWFISPRSVTFNQFLWQWPEISGYFGAGRDTQQECLFIATWANKLYLIVSKFKAAIKCLINYITFGTTVAGHTGHMVRVLLRQPSQSLNRRVEGSYYHSSTVKSYGLDWCACVKKMQSFLPFGISLSLTLTCGF